MAAGLPAQRRALSANATYPVVSAGPIVDSIDRPSLAVS
jgi:hypothetical protein